MMYGLFLIYYVTTKKFEYKPRKPKSQAWHVWDKGTISHNLPVISKHEDWLGWQNGQHYQQFGGHIYLCCMPRGGPYSDIDVWIKKRVLRRLKWSDVPYRGFFFTPEAHLSVDRLNNVPKKSPFEELSKAIRETDLANVQNISIGLVKNPDTGIFTFKVIPNFAIDTDFENAINEMF